MPHPTQTFRAHYRATIPPLQWLTLPAAHPVARLPWIRQMHHPHPLHHRRKRMQGRNFNIVLPLMDYLFGTLHWQPPPHDNPESS